MSVFPDKLAQKLTQRSQSGELRELESAAQTGVDFSSNDYLGFARLKTIEEQGKAILEQYDIQNQGATGSRLLTGNHKLYNITEKYIADFHQSEAALIFNSGYNANLGFFQAIPQRNDVIFYDEYVHASIREGIRLSHARALKFKHNDVEELENKLAKARSENAIEETYIVTEAVFSMDGDHPNLEKLVSLCKTYNGHLVVDEAHGIGVMGRSGEGLIQHLKLEKDVFARIITFGKALGSHGAAILGSNLLKNYLTNYARSLIYTTALPPHTVASILAGYETLNAFGNDKGSLIQQLQQHVECFQREVHRLGLAAFFIPSDSAIQAALIPGSERVTMLSRKLKQSGYNVLPIRYPTVPKDSERLRFCLHSYTTEEDIKEVLLKLKSLIAAL